MKQKKAIRIKAIRIITGAKYNDHTKPIFSQLRLLKLDDIIIIQDKNIKIYVSTK